VQLYDEGEDKDVAEGAAGGGDGVYCERHAGMVMVLHVCYYSADIGDRCKAGESRNEP